MIETFFFRLTIVSSDTRFPFFFFTFFLYDWIVGSDVGMRGVGYVRVCQGIIYGEIVGYGKGRAKLGPYGMVDG